MLAVVMVMVMVMRFMMMMMRMHMLIEDDSASVRCVSMMVVRR